MGDLQAFQLYSLMGQKYGLDIVWQALSVQECHRCWEYPRPLGVPPCVMWQIQWTNPIVRANSRVLALHWVTQHICANHAVTHGSVGNQESVQNPHSTREKKRIKLSEFQNLVCCSQSRWRLDTLVYIQWQMSKDFWVPRALRLVTMTHLAKSLNTQVRVRKAAIQQR